jgi:aryl-alcohol dehydrogenase
MPDPSVKARAAILRESSGPVSIEDVTLDGPSPPEVVVRIAGVGICHTDFLPRTPVVRPPVIPGHEASGVVEAVGAAVADVAVGDHVVLSFRSCGSCRNCTDALPAYCDFFWPLNMSGFREGRTTNAADSEGRPVQARWFGQSSFADRCVVDARQLVKVDASLPLELLGPLSCGVLTGAGSVFESLRVGPGDSIAIFGAGTVGLSAVMAARVADATTIVAVDLKQERLDLATELGATHTFLATTPDLTAQIHALVPGGLDFSLDNTGVPSVIATAVDVLRLRGTVGMLGVALEPIPFTPQQFAMGRTVKGILMGDAVPQLLIPRLVELWQQGRFPFDRLITTFALDDINEAEKAMHAGDVIKPVLLPHHREDGA